MRYENPDKKRNHRNSLASVTPSYPLAVVQVRDDVCHTTGNHIRTWARISETSHRGVVISRPSQCTAVIVSFKYLNNYIIKSDCPRHETRRDSPAAKPLPRCVADQVWKHDRSFGHFQETNSHMIEQQNRMEIIEAK